MVTIQHFNSHMFCDKKEKRKIYRKRSSASRRKPPQSVDAESVVAEEVVLDSYFFIFNTI